MGLLGKGLAVLSAGILSVLALQLGIRHCYKRLNRQYIPLLPVGTEPRA